MVDGLVLEELFATSQGFSIMDALTLRWMHQDQFGGWFIAQEYLDLQAEGPGALPPESEPPQIKILIHEHSGGPSPIALLIRENL